MGTKKLRHDLPPPRKIHPEGSRPLSQAERVVARFGGFKVLHDALAAVGQYRSISNLYRWTYPIEIGGTGGLIPGRAMPDVLRAAKWEGILLTPEDLEPRSLAVGADEEEAE